MEKCLEIICENIRNDYTEGVAIIGPTGSGKNKYAMEISGALNKPYKLISFTSYSSSLNELYDAVENGEVLTIEGIEFINDQLLDKIYEILVLVQPGQKFQVLTAPGSELLFGTKPIYITKNKNFKCILLLNSNYASMLTKNTRPMNYLLLISHHFPVLMAPIRRNNIWLEKKVLN